MTRRGTRYTQGWTVALLKEQEGWRGDGGVASEARNQPAEVLYRCKAKYVGLDVGDAQKLKTSQLCEQGYDGAYRGVTE